MIFLDLGLNTLFIKNVARDKTQTKKYLNNLTSMKIFISIFVLGLVIFTANILKYPAETQILIGIMCMVIIGTSLLDYVFAVLSSWEKMNLEAILKIVNKTFIALLGISVLFFLGNTTALSYRIDVFVAVMALGYFLSVGIGFYLIKRNITVPGLNYEFKFWVELIMNSLPLALTTVFIILYFRVDVVLLSFIGRTDAEIGWYAAAIKVIDAISALPILIIGGIFPILSDLSKNQPEKMKRVCGKSAKIMIMLSVPIALIIYFFSDSLVPLVYGQNFIKTADVLKILAWATVSIFLNYLFMNILIVAEKQSLVAVSTGISVLVNVVSNILLIPQYGYIGASYSVVITQLVLLSFNYYFVVKYAFTKNEQLILETAG
jgi:O-antigen/teichoic acid export membrane protein